MADSWNEINARVGNVTNSLGEQKEIQREVFEIAQSTRQEYDATGTLFVRMARFSDELGASQQDVLDVTKTVNRALVVGGASAQEARSTILQLSQALASGRLQGDELRSLNEAAPQLMDLVAKYFKVTVGQLKKMGAEGKLLSKDIFAAILRGRDKMAIEFEKMPITFAQGFDIMMNYIGQMFFEMNRETGIFQDLAHGAVNAIKSITEAAKSGAKRVNGWGNALKLATGGIGAVVLGVKAFNIAMLATERNITILALLTGQVKLLAGALWGLLANPITWWAVGVALAISAIGLAIEDLYTWISGGESIIGSFLGSWEDLTNGMRKAWDNFSKWFDDLMHMRVIDVIGVAIDKLGELSDMITFGPWESLKGIGSYLSGAITTEEVGLTQMQREAYGINNTNSNASISQNNNVNITQNIAGAGNDVVESVGKATSDAFGDSTSKFARDIDYSIIGGETN